MKIRHDDDDDDEDNDDKETFLVSSLYKVDASGLVERWWMKGSRGGRGSCTFSTSNS